MKFKIGDIIESKSGVKFKIDDIYNKGESTCGYILKAEDKFLNDIIKKEHSFHDGFWIPKRKVESGCKHVSKD